MIHALTKIASVIAILAIVSSCDMHTGPNEAEIKAHLSTFLPKTLKIDDLSYENFAEADASKGRTSCKGTLVLAEDLYDNGDNKINEDLTKIIGEADLWYYLNKYQNTHEPVNFYQIVSQSGLKIPYSAEFNYFKKVDGWELQGLPEYQNLKGFPSKNMRPGKAAIVGTTDYDAIIQEIAEIKVQNENAGNNFAIKIEQYLANGKSLTPTEFKKNIVNGKPLTSSEISENIANEKPLTPTEIKQNLDPVSTILPFKLILNAPSIKSPMATRLIGNNTKMFERRFFGQGEATWITKGRFGNSYYEAKEIVPITYEVSIWLEKDIWISKMVLMMPGKDDWGAGEQKFQWNGEYFQSKDEQYYSGNRWVSIALLEKPQEVIAEGKIVPSIKEVSAIQDKPISPHENTQPANRIDIPSVSPITETQNSSATQLIIELLEITLTDGSQHETEIVKLIKKISDLPKPAKGERKSARAVNEKALSLFNSGNLAESIELFNQATKLDHSDAEILNNLGYALLRHGNLEDSKIALLDALAVRPDRALAWQNLADVLTIQGDKSMGVAAYENVYRFSKNRAKTHKFMKKLNDTDGSVLKDARQQAMAWAEKTYAAENLWQAIQQP